MTRVKKRGDAPIVNCYKHIEYPSIDGSRTYENYDHCLIKLPFQMVICGKTGSCKTNFLINLINNMGCFHKVYLFVRQPEEPLYFDFIQKRLKWQKDENAKREKLFKKRHKDDGKVYPPLKTLYLTKDPTVEDLALELYTPNTNNLVVFDDMLTQPKSIMNGITDLVIQGRKRGCSVVFISQRFFAIPKTIRDNTAYLVLKSIVSKPDLRLILDVFTGLQDVVTPEELVRLYHKIIKGPSSVDALLLDNETTDELLRVRKNFTPILASTDAEVPVLERLRPGTLEETDEETDEDADPGETDEE